MSEVFSAFHAMLRGLVSPFLGLMSVYIFIVPNDVQTAILFALWSLGSKE